jgi:hypothetical protein
MRWELVCLLVLLSWPSLAQEPSGGGRDRTPKYSNEFLQLGVGGRQLGMALTGVAFTSDVSSGYWNPAGLIGMEEDRQLMLMHSAYFGGMANYDFGAFTMPLDENSRVAVSLIRFSVDDIPDTRFLFDGNGAINYDNIRLFAAADYALIGSYSRKLPILNGVNAGANFKIIHRVVGDFGKAWGFGLDAGLQKEVKGWKLGLMARDVLGTFNAWTHNVDELREIYAITDNELPANSVEITVPRLMFGVARQMDIGEKFSVLAAVDLDFTFDGKRNTLIRSDFTSIDPKLGLEVGYQKQFFLRMGIGQFQQTEDFEGNTSWVMQPTAGLGFKVSEVMIDYAFTDAFNQAEGLYSHVFSIKVDLYGNKK